MLSSAAWNYLLFELQNQDLFLFFKKKKLFVRVVCFPFVVSGFTVAVTPALWSGSVLEAPLMRFLNC